MRQRVVPRGIGGGLAVAAAIALGLLGGALRLVPVSSQAITLEAARAPDELAADEPWAPLWALAPKQEVPLSAQNIALPFGGGSVTSLTARAFQDGRRLYLLLEWPDAQPDDVVNGLTAFADAAAVQFPGTAGPQPPFTMGTIGQPVNIWQWKALWQADMARGFTTTRDRYPNTYVDMYPAGDDPLYKTAFAAGNPLSQRDHESPVENLIAEGFGTLTHADVQDVAGSGEWRDGRWRALFVRDLQPSGDGYASFAVGSTTAVAFAVWDGASGDRNGQKSIAPFIDLSIGDRDVAARFGAEQVGIASLILLIAAAAVTLILVSARTKPQVG